MNDYRVLVAGAPVLTTSVRSSAIRFAMRRGGIVQQLVFGEWQTLDITASTLAREARRA